jgi:zinc protease
LGWTAGLWAGWFILALAHAAAAAPPPAERATLSNGLVLLHRDNPSSLTLAVSCFVRVSALMETRDSAGWRHLAQQTLRDLPDAQGRGLQERVAERAAQMRVQTSADYVETLFLGTADQLALLLGYAREVLTPARLSRALVEPRRQQVLRQLANRRQLPALLAQDMAQAALFAGTPCSWPLAGTFEISALSTARLETLRNLHYAPNQAVVAVSGPVSWEQCRAEVQRQLGALLPRATVREPALKLSRRATGRCLYAPWEGETATVLTAAAIPPPGHPDFAPAAVLTAVLGSGEGSRLFISLRDARGLAYAIDTDLTPSRLCGTAQILASCEPKQAGEVFRIMRAEVAGLESRPPSEAEVQRAASYLTASFLLGHQRNAEIAHYLGLFEALIPARGERVDLAALFEQVTPAQVGAATKWLHDRTVWVQVGGKLP